LISLGITVHPDKNNNNSEESKRRFQKIQEAYEILSDSQKIMEYNQSFTRMLNNGWNTNILIRI